MTPLKTNELRATFDGVSMGPRPTQLDENRASRQVYHVPRRGAVEVACALDELRP